MAYVYYCENNFQCQGSSPLYYNNETNELYTIRTSQHMSMEHEVGRRQQKNWSPFAFSLSGKHTPNMNNLNEDNWNDNLRIEKEQEVPLFIYSIKPHRIIYANLVSKKIIF